ncbi:hypothetical protein Lal_00009277 [Lupinus albus]|nr:hypothetical protein Lal_00009277 [Lupinus albus]
MGRYSTSWDGDSFIIMAYELTEIKKIGIGLIGFGIFFTFLGVVLFFDRGLLALGNIFWLAGVAILIGWRSMWNLFTNRTNYKGSASFVLGLFLIFVRWPIVGILLEIYGCVVLFGGFWASVKVFLYHIPVVGWAIRSLKVSEVDCFLVYGVWLCVFAEFKHP